MDKSRFFLYGYYGVGNFGDELLLESIVTAIKKRVPSAFFYIRNLNYVDIFDKYNDCIHHTDIEKIIANQKEYKIIRIIRYLKEYWRYFNECDYFVIGGGTIIHEKKSLILLTIICIMAGLKGLKIIAIGIGISELKKTWSKLMVKAINKMSSFFSVRDEAAYIQCVNSKCGNKVLLYSDLVYSLDLGKNENFILENSKVIGISLTHFDFKDKINIFSNVIEKLINDGWIIALLSFQNMSDSSAKVLDDKIALKEIMDNLESDKKAKIQLIEINRKTIDKVFSDMRVLISMRFHGLVVASMYGVPFLGISHDNKIEEICKEFKMPYYDHKMLEADTLYKEIQKLIHMTIDNEILAKQIELSKSNFKFIS